MFALIVVVASLSASFDAKDDYRATFERLAPFDDAIDALLIQLHHGSPVDSQVIKVLEQTASQFEALHRISTSNSIDWGLQYDDGPELLLPELALSRSASRLLDAKFIVAAGNGDAAQGAHAIGVLWRMSSHIAEQRVLVSSLVALSMIKMGDASVERALEMGLIDQAMAGLLEQQYALLEQDDFLKVEAALAQERASMIMWLESKLQEDTASLEQSFNGLGLQAPGNVFAVAMLRAQLVKAGEAYDAVIAASKLDDQAQSIAAIEAIEAEVSAGSYGTVAAVLLPAASSVFGMRDEAIADFQARRATLKRIADGEVAPWEEASRQWLWVLASRHAERCDGPWWANAQVAGEVDLRLLHAMGGQDGVYPEPWGEVDVPVQWWLPGQWNLLQGLFARAIERLDAGHISSAGVDVAMALEITVSLSNDGRVAPSLVAAASLPIVAALVERLVIAGFNVSSLTSLVRRLPSVRNPAGMGSAAKQQAARLKAWMQRCQEHYAFWIGRSKLGPGTDYAGPAPFVTPIMVIDANAGGVIAALAAIHSLRPQRETNEPVGVFETNAPPGLHSGALQTIATKAQTLTRADEPHTLAFEFIDPSEAAVATQQLRDAVLHR